METTTIKDKETDHELKQSPCVLDSSGAIAALKRAAIKARRRAIEVSGSVPIYRDGKIVHVTEVPELYEEETDRV